MHLKTTEGQNKRTGSSDHFAPQRRRYMAGLDGLRALAILAVIFYHLNQMWLPGGFLGVAVFFTLSGYLITDILANGGAGQRQGNLGLTLITFWMRRARRLLPGMLTVVSAVVLWSWFGDQALASTLRGDVPAALLYISNWWFIYHKVSYFQSFGPPSPLGHLWSLAVEEQFYLIWPVLLGLGLKFTRKRGVLAGWVLALALGSALLMAVLYHPGTDPSRVYYGTDTRGFALLMGAALALVWPSGKLKKRISVKARMQLDVAGLVSLLLLVYWTFSADQYDAYLYEGGLVGIALVSAVLIAVLGHPGSRLGFWLSSRPLVWIGKRAYGLYLWHFPVIALSTPETDSGGSHGLRIMLQLAVTFLLAAASYRWIENPVRKYGLSRWIKGMSAFLTGRRKGNLLPAASAGIMGFLIIFSLLHLYVPVLSSGNIKIGEESGSSASVLPVYQSQPEQSDSPQSQDDEPVQPAASAQEPVNTPAPSSGNPVTGTSKAITAIGDSVMLDITNDLHELYPDAVIDGQIGRQMWDAPSLLQQLNQQGKLHDTVIIELGTNGAFSKRQFRKVLDELKEAKHILLVNTRVPRPWESVVNEALVKATDEDPRIQLVDWYTASAGQSSYFEKDGVHLKAEGAAAYTSLLQQVLSKL